MSSFHTSCIKCNTTSNHEPEEHDIHVMKVSMKNIPCHTLIINTYNLDDVFVQPYMDRKVSTLNYIISRLSREYSVQIADDYDEISSENFYCTFSIYRTSDNTYSNIIDGMYRSNVDGDVFVKYTTDNNIIRIHHIDINNINISDDDSLKLIEAD